MVLSGQSNTIGVVICHAHCLMFKYLNVRTEPEATDAMESHELRVTNHRLVTAYSAFQMLLIINDVAIFTSLIPVIHDFRLRIQLLVYAVLLEFTINITSIEILLHYSHFQQVLHQLQQSWYVSCWMYSLLPPIHIQN
jgi:hypothetical protein